MYYVHRDKDGNITRMTNQPCGSIERLTNDHPDVIAFLNPPARPDPQAELDAALAAVQPTIDAVADASTRAALQAILDALTGAAGPARVSGRPK